ncbi:MAG TPA: VWA domain-containing protein [Candidatus Limnocylindrales bacterium]
MPFATPLALLGLLFLPLVVAMYLLKLRRDEAVVPSTLLWHRLVADVEANAPWQRLRRSLLLLLQLLLVAALAFLAARPFLERPAGLARDLVVIVDASASMGATDMAPSRLEAAKSAAIDALRELPTGGKVSVIAAGRTARIVATGSSDLGRIRQAIASIQVTASNGDLGDALTLASALAARSGDAEILIATDAALATVPTRRVEAPVRVIQVGRERKNQAIVALAIRTAPSGLTKSAFVSIANFDVDAARRRIEVYADGVLLEARNVFMDPQQRADVVIDDITQQNTRRVDVIEIRLVGESTDSDAAPDQLAIDDRAWAVVPSDELRQILLVGDGDPYLETALSYLPNTELYGRATKDYDSTTGLDEFELIIFEDFLPRVLPDTAVLAIAPPRSGPLGDVTGTLTNPGIGSLNPDEPILRYVDLSTIHIAEAKKMVLPAWARTVIPGPQGSPLLYAGELAGQRTAVMAFEPRRSDLPLQVAFPILLANLTGELLGGSGAPTEAVRPSAPVVLTVPAGATGVKVTLPDGSSVDLVPGTVGGTSVTFSQTDQLGVYQVTPIAGPASSPGPSSSAGPSSTASARPSAGPSPSRTPVPADPGAPVRFAVDLFDPAESNIAPGSPSRLVALGGFNEPSPAASGSPGTSPPATAQPSAEPTGTATAGGPGTTERPPARDELWVPIVLLVLLVLLVEWAVYQRDALIRLWRGVGTRFRRRPAGGA